MPEDIQSLIKKIQEEGIKKAEEKAKEIEEGAKRNAEEILRKAREEVESLLRETREKIAKEESYSRALLQQAARDLLLNLKREINQILGKILLIDIREVLTPERTAQVVESLIKGYRGEVSPEIVLTLKKEDCDFLGKYFLNKLKEEIKKGIVLKPSEEISGGFLISYDGGKSYFDFTDKGLAEYIGRYLKPRLKDLFNSL